MFNFATQSPYFNSEFKQQLILRQQELLNHLGDAVAYIPANSEVIKSVDTTYPFRQNSYFYYLTGFIEPDAALVIVGGDQQKVILFCRDKNPEREIWDGFRYGPELAKEVFPCDQALSIDLLASKLIEYTCNRQAIHYPFGESSTSDNIVSETLKQVRQKGRLGINTPNNLIDLRAKLDQMRLCKDAYEFSLMQKAAEISSAAHSLAMKNTRPGSYEYQIEADIYHYFRYHGATGHAYTPIVASGKNACVLHYIENNQILRTGDLLLIDAGCEYQGYAADITRTFPVSGKFSPAQRDCYEIVLAAHQAAIDQIKPGASFIAPHDAALNILVQGMIDLRLLPASAGSHEEIIENKTYQKFFMHKTSHWLGLDVHDVGSNRGEGANWCNLQENQILTVEPGIYIAATDDVASEFHGIGIRIEDDVRVTANGAQVYTNTPRKVNEIEELMRN